MANQKSTAAEGNVKMMRYLAVAAVVVVAFFASYQLATATSGSDDAASQQYASQPANNPAPATGGDAAGGCACCDTGGSGEAVEGAAVVEADGVQRIAVDASNGYDPNVIVLEAGTPAEITFSEGYGCMAEVMSADLGFFEDLQSGPKTVALDGLAAGTYDFSCGMEMVFGQVVVQ
jgi:hypothetical protein